MRGRTSHSIRWRGLALLLCGAVLGGAPCGSQQQELPSVKQILDRFVEIIGGQAAIEKVKTRVIRGERVIGQESGRPLEIAQKYPNLWLVQIEEPEGTSLQGSDGKIVWSKPARGQVQVVSADEAADAQREYNIHLELAFREFFAQMIVHGVGNIEGREVYVIEAKAERGHITWLYFDVATGFLLRREYRENAADGPRFWRTEYTDYRDVDGVKLPFQIRRVGPDRDWVLNVTEVKQNVTLSDARFAQP